jgi:hypothetical protein
MVNKHNNLGRLAGFHTFQLDLITGYKASKKIGYFVQYFVIGEDDKAIFSNSWQYIYLSILSQSMKVFHVYKFRFLTRVKMQWLVSIKINIK